MFGTGTYTTDHEIKRFDFYAPIYVGVDATGYDVKFFGDTTGKYWLWDQSADKMIVYGGVEVGVDDTGHDVKFFGATASAYMEWDESADRLNIVTVSGRALSGEEHAVSITHGGTLSSGDSMVGLNIATTTSGTAGTWASALFGKITQGTTKNVNGYLSAAEFEVNLSGSYNPSDWAVLVLNSNDDNTGGSNSNNAVIMFRDYGDREPANFIRLYDTSAGSADTSIFATKSSAAVSHTLRIMVGTTPYWIMVSNAR